MALFRNVMGWIGGGDARKKKERTAATSRAQGRAAAHVWAEVREALQDNRSEDAVQLAKLAAEAEGRGEQEPSPFGFSASSAGIELSALTKVRLGDVLSGLAPALEHRLWVALAFASLRGDGLDAAARHVEGALLGASYEWSDFERWHRHFAEIGFFPAMWKGLEQQPDPTVCAGVLEALGRLSHEARLVLTENAVIERRIARSLSEIKARSFLTEAEFSLATPELQAAGCLKYPAEAADKLLLLDVGALRSALEARGLKKGGRKEELVERLAGSASEHEIATLLPPNAPDDLALLGLAVQGPVRDGLSYERGKLWLLTHTLSFMRYTDRDMRSMSGMSYKIKILDTADECPVCRKWAGESLDPKTVSRKELPPYHPGCRCDTIADVRY